MRIPFILFVTWYRCNPRMIMFFVVAVKNGQFFISLTSLQSNGYVLFYKISMDPSRSIIQLVHLSVWHFEFVPFPIVLIKVLPSPRLCDEMGVFISFHSSIANLHVPCSQDSPVHGMTRVILIITFQTHSEQLLRNSVRTTLIVVFHIYRARCTGTHLSRR